MLVRILKRTFSGVEYGPEQRVLKLGGENSAGVERLEFELPEEWEGLAVTVHVQQMDGTLPEPALLGEDRCLTVDRMFTACEKGLWMLKAVGEDGYCALTKPARYECYETFSTDGAEEISPSKYESFVAQVLGAANDASQQAKSAKASAEKAQSAMERAEKAAARMDAYEPYTLPSATADTLGGVKIGSGLEVDADGTLHLTDESLKAALGYSLGEKILRLERMMNMDGKLVYTDTATAGSTAVTLQVPEAVDYVVIRMIVPMDTLSATTGSGGVGTSIAMAADYGSTRIVRGGSADAMTGGENDKATCTGRGHAKVTFAADGTLTVEKAYPISNSEYKYPFNVEGYQYL